jgi:hypothetical protein
MNFPENGSIPALNKKYSNSIYKRLRKGER